jgi:hypothetical protein
MSIVAPPGFQSPPTPARLYWHPHRTSQINIAQGATQLLAVARVGPDVPGALFDTPEQALPWSLSNGAWRFEIQLSAEGFPALTITAGLRVFPVDDLPDQAIEWTDLAVDGQPYAI